MSFDKVQQLIAAAFPKLEPLSAGFLPTMFDHARAVELCGDLKHLLAVDLPPALGAVLFEACSMCPTSHSNAWELENLIYFLNANTDLAEVAGDNEGRDSNEVAAELDLRRDRQRDFHTLTRLQKSAVRSWLEEFQQLTAPRPLRAELADALKLWKKLDASE